MSSAVTLTITVRRGIGRAATDAWAASLDVFGTPICRYGGTQAEAARLARGTALRCLGQLAEKGLPCESVTFHTVTAK